MRTHFGLGIMTTIDMIPKWIRVKLDTNRPYFYGDSFELLKYLTDTKLQSNVKIQGGLK